MIEHLASCLPLEGVGLLSAGASDSGLRVRDFYPGRNSDASPRRYTMDPVDVRAALFEMQRRGTRLGAIVHSHPRTPPTLSATDLAEARYAGVLSVIVGFEPQCEVRAWSFEFGAEGTVVGFGEVQIVEF
jgi:proteasome lid subunit RPN8/RPN11